LISDREDIESAFLNTYPLIIRQIQTALNNMTNASISWLFFFSISQRIGELLPDAPDKSAARKHL
jgi:hypothetical protein